MQYQVGDEVGFGRWHWGTLITHGISRIKKINGYGHIILENGRVFDKMGMERKNERVRLMRADGVRNALARHKQEQERRGNFDLAIHLLQMNRVEGRSPLNADVKAQLLDLIQKL